MTEKQISNKSLQNLVEANREARQITKEALEVALLNLLEKKNMAEISISELVAKAGVSRNAFYRNYNSKEAILEGHLLKVVRRIVRRIKAFDLNTQISQAWYYLFMEAKQERQLLTIIFKYNLQDLITKVVTKRLMGYQKWKQKQVSHYTCLFWSSAIVSLLYNWIQDDMIIPAEEMAAMKLPLLP